MYLNHQLIRGQKLNRNVAKVGQLKAFLILNLCHLNSVPPTILCYCDLQLLLTLKWGKGEVWSIKISHLIEKDDCEWDANCFMIILSPSVECNML